ncbi:MAG: TonB family protein [Limisphaerales bacterium]
MAVAAYQLKSELARVCLPAPERSADRRMAWVNSLCLLFLLIGVFGDQSKLPVPKQAPPLERPVPIIVEPLPATPPPAVQPQNVERQSDEEKPEAQRFVAVTLDTPAIHFAVPTIGNLLVPLAAAVPPPAMPLGQSDTVAHQARTAPLASGSTGTGGDRPIPDYPPMAKQMGIQGTVLLLFTVDDVGAITSVSIKQSSGSPLLDHAAEQWVKRRWIQPPKNGGHVFQVPITYKLQSD